MRGKDDCYDHDDEHNRSGAQGDLRAPDQAAGPACRVRLASLSQGAAATSRSARSARLGLGALGTHALALGLGARLGLPLRSRLCDVCSRRRSRCCRITRSIDRASARPIA